MKKLLSILLALGMLSLVIPQGAFAGKKSKQKAETYSTNDVIKTVVGVVTDAATGDSLVGVCVKVIGTPNSTATDVQGQYSIKVPAQDRQFEFSYVGYCTMIVNVPAAKIRLNVSLPPINDIISNSVSR